LTDENIAIAEEPRMFTADLAHVGERTAETIQTQQDVPAQPAEQPSLFPQEEAGDLRARWDMVQAGFVDEPRRAVSDADALVAAAMKRLAETFAAERSKLETNWESGDDVSTEELRLALQRYRAFFSRLLAV
jgi:hypothetical protein